MKCKVHGKTLMETTAFRCEGEWQYGDISLQIQILEKLPHSIHFDYSLKPDRLYKVPGKVFYCPDCESQARMMRWQGQIDAEPGAPPNGGPAEPSANSTANDGPPSVS